MTKRKRNAKHPIGTEEDAMSQVELSSLLSERHMTTSEVVDQSLKRFDEILRQQDKKREPASPR